MLTMILMVMRFLETTANHRRINGWHALSPTSGCANLGAAPADAPIVFCSKWHLWRFTQVSFFRTCLELKRAVESLIWLIEESIERFLPLDSFVEYVTGTDIEIVTHSTRFLTK